LARLLTCPTASSCAAITARSTPAPTAPSSSSSGASSTPTRRSGAPTGNAVVERVIRTLKEEVVWLRDWESIDELRAAIMAWVRRYNEQRPHQALGWKTPAEYRAEHLGAVAVEKAA